MRFAQWLLEGCLDGDHLINHVAMIALMDSVNDTFSHIICEESSVPVAYALIKSHYRGACGARKTELFTAITNKRMQPGQSIESYVSQFAELQQDLKESGGTLPQSEIVDMAVVGVSNRLMLVRQHHALQPLISLVALQRAMVPLDSLSEHGVQLNVEGMHSDGRTRPNADRSGRGQGRGRGNRRYGHGRTNGPEGPRRDRFVGHVANADTLRQIVLIGNRMMTGHGLGELKVNCVKRSTSSTTTST
jgi:hypothetical protein